MPYCLLKLENELRANLNRSRSARTHRRISCCDIRRSAPATKTSSGRIIEAVPVLSAIGIREVRVIEDIEELCAELQPLAFSKVKVLGDREIKVLEAGILEHIPSHVSELSKWRRHHYGIACRVATEQV